MQGFLGLPLRRKCRCIPLLGRWGVMVSVICLVTLLRIGLLGEQPGWPYELFVPIVAVASLCFGQSTGYVAAVLSSVIAAWVFIPPMFTLVVLNDPVQRVGFCLSLAINSSIVWLIERLHDLAIDQERTHLQLMAAAEDMRRSHAEKTALWEESEHRTRNDLQRLLGTVIMQEKLTTATDDAREVIGSVKRRIEAMVSLHGRLSTITGTAHPLSVDSRTFLAGIVDDLAICCELRPIVFTTQLEAHNIKMQQAILIGLIMHEAMANIFKYAFPDNRRGRVQVRFQRQDDGFLLSIEDNGVGMPTGMPAQGSGLGSSIIRSVAAQLQGTASLANLASGGTAVTVRFPSVEQDNESLADQ